jgi:UDP-N-acetylmuramoyl-tripeptide--D-alanyl-D-alanine ligase
MNLTVGDLLRLKPGFQRDLDGAGSREFGGVSSDSRTVRHGDLFFALRGESFDGHHFVRDAVNHGAAAVVVDNRACLDEITGVPAVVVHNTTRALGDLARIYRRRFGFPVLAVGGSNGKTTTKDMTAQVLGASMRVVSTKGNLNNHIGVPHTIFRFTRGDEVAVVEIGTNHPGEIAYLCKVLQPTHGMVTTISREHLEFFKTVEGVAREEGTLYRYLRRSSRGSMFVNADDPLVTKQAGGLRGTWSYGFGSPVSRVQGKLAGLDNKGCALLSFGMRKKRQGARFRLRIPGMHHALNALAAAATGLAFDVSPGAIREALEAFTPAANRMEVLEIGGVVVYNDTYNANPDSVIAALRTLADGKPEGKRIAVLGDMRELGECSAEEHAGVGREVGRLGIDYLLTVGELARHIHESADVPARYHYDQKNVLAEYLLELLAPGDAVLVKGSRGMRMEDIVSFIVQRLKPAEKT